MVIRGLLQWAMSNRFAAKSFFFNKNLSLRRIFNKTHTIMKSKIMKSKYDSHKAKEFGGKALWLITKIWNRG